jgi:hypothetical protein
MHHWLTANVNAQRPNKQKKEKEKEKKSVCIWSSGALD